MRLEPQERRAASDSWGRSCNGKAPYANEQAAITRAAQVQREMKEIIGVYQCQHCGKFHIGHIPYWVREEIDASKLKSKGSKRGA